MNTTASMREPYIDAPRVPLGHLPPRKPSNRPPRPESREPEADEEGELGIEQYPEHVVGTAEPTENEGPGWSIATQKTGQATKTTREILDAIDADTLREARIKGGTKPQIEVNRDRIAALLELRDEWQQPDEVYADESWEICIVWRSEYGKVEIGTEQDGTIGYYVTRTLSEKNKEGSFHEHNVKELTAVMSWLNRIPEEI